MSIPVRLHSAAKLAKRNCFEETLQQYANALLDRYQSQGLLAWFHVPNESGFKASVGWHMKRKKMGLKPGIPDIIILFPEKKILFIELKANNNKIKQKNPYIQLTGTQKRWKEIIEKFGFDYIAISANSTDDLSKQLKSVLKNCGIKTGV